MKKRVISAAVLAAIFIPLIIIGGIAFEIGTAVVACLSLKELLDLIEREKKIPLIVKLLSYLSTGLLVMSADSILACVGLVILFIIMPIIFLKDEVYNYGDASKLFGIVMFLGFGFYILNR